MRIAGYAALFDRVDRGGDVIRPGAFAASLAGGAPRPLLWQHRPDALIGEARYLSEDRRGLRLIAQIDPLQPHSGEALQAIRSGAARGLSFGYRVRRAEAGSAGSLRELLDLELVELSLVTTPMMPGAKVHMIAT